MGLSDWLKNRKARSSSEQLVWELDQFIVRLKGLEPFDLGIVAAQAADLRWRLAIDGDRVDLMMPELAIMQVPDLLSGLTATGLKMQQGGFEARVPGFLVWIHTLRACEYLEIRFSAKQMWRLIENGFPYAEEAARSFSQLNGLQLHIELPLEIPHGFKLASD